MPRHVLLGRLDGWATAAVNAVAGPLATINPRRRLNGAWVVLRESLISRVGQQRDGDYDEFVVECHSADPQPFRLILELMRHQVVSFRHAFEIRAGPNYHTLPAASFGFLGVQDHCKLAIYPDNDQERRLVFTWLDFVKYAGGAPVPTLPAGTAAAPAAKVKCVAWDLDNTLWQGILAEASPESLAARPEMLAAIRQLDERGILQTVVSKNNYDDAWPVIQRLGLQDCFLYPAINWGPKSENLRQIAKRLNINIDTFALVDDSPFERAEVAAALPMVRTYTDQQAGQLCSLPEFDVPITDMSRQRRRSYLVEMQRHHARESFQGDNLQFLRSCQMRMRVFVPRESAHIERCLEVIQRSNQLNLSSRRYTAGEFAKLLATAGMLCIAIECEDRFGRYGIVGFASVDERGADPLAIDFVISCRVAQKRVEHTFYQWLARRELARGQRRLLAELVRTSRNEALVRVFTQLPFRKLSADGAKELLELPLDQARQIEETIELRDEV